MTSRARLPRANARLLAYILLCCAFAFRLIYWHAQWTAPLIIVGDEGNYYQGAVLLARGTENFWTSDVWLRWGTFWLLPPLYPLSLAALLKLLGEDVLALRLFQALFGTLNVALVYRLGRVLFDEWIGVGAALLAAIFLPLVTLPVLIMTENLFVPLVVLAFIFLVEFARRHSLAQLFAAGLALALATLTRAVPTLFFPLVALWLLTRAQRRWKILFAQWLAFGVGALLVFAPWGIRNYLMYQRFLITDTMGGANFVEANGMLDPNIPKLQNPIDYQSAVMSSGLDNLRAHPDLIWNRILPNTRHLLRLETIQTFSQDGYEGTSPEFVRDLILDDGLFVTIVFFSIVGLVYARDASTRALFLLWLGYNVILLVVLFFAAVRYRLPNMPLLLPYAAYGWRVLREGRVMRTLRWRPALVLSLGAAFFVLTMWDYPARFAQIIARDSSINAARAAMQSGAIDVAESRLAHARELDPRAASVDFAFGDFYRATGDATRAVEAYTHALTARPDSLETRARAGDSFRALGRNDLAARMFNMGGEEENLLLNVAWDHKYFSEATNRVDVGSLDAGYTRWMSPSEKIADDEGELTYRWTSSLAQVRLFAPTQGASVLSLRMNAFRPEGVPQPKLRVLVSGTQVGQFVVRPIWRVYNLNLSLESKNSKMLIVTLQSDTWLAAAEGQILPVPPRLGVQLDWVQVVSSSQ